MEIEEQVNNVRVITRFRPFVQREKDLGLDSAAGMYSIEDSNKIVIKSEGKDVVFPMSHCFDVGTLQEEVFEVVGRKPMLDLFKGFNSTVFAYGQTGAGKTFSMVGVAHDPVLRGLIPRCSNLLFESIRNADKTEFTVSCSYLEIYLEQISDLLNPKNTNLQVREHRGRGVFVDGLSSEYVRSAMDILELLRIGEQHKHIASTKMNAQSSRSHCCFTIFLEARDESDSTTEARFNLVDLAGSERVGKTETSGLGLEQAKKINLSLTHLSQCIQALATNPNQHVNYRDSKLTRLLQDSLGGNSKTTVLVALSPHPDNLPETLSSLRFAKSCSTLKTTAKKNMKLDADALQKMVDALKAEISRVQTSKPDVEVSTKEIQTEGDDEDLPLQKISAIQLEEKKNILAGLDEELEQEQKMQDELKEQLEDMQQKLEELKSKLPKAVGGEAGGPRKASMSFTSILRRASRAGSKRVISQGDAMNLGLGIAQSGSFHGGKRPVSLSTPGSAVVASGPRSQSVLVVPQSIQEEESPPVKPVPSFSGGKEERAKAPAKQVTIEDQGNVVLGVSGASPPPSPKAVRMESGSESVAGMNPQQAADYKQQQKNRKKELKELIKAKTVEWEKAQDANANLELKCDDQNDIIARQQEAVADLEQKIQDLEDEIDSLEAEKEEEHQRLAELESDLAKLMKEESQLDPQASNVRHVVSPESVLHHEAQEDENVLSGMFKVFSFGLA